MLKALRFEVTVLALLIFTAFVFPAKMVQAITNTHSLDLERSSSQYLSISDGNQTGLDLSGDLTLETWVKFESVDVNNTFIDKWNNVGVNQRSYYFDYTDNDRLRLLISDDGTGNNDTYYVTWNASSDIWYHLAVSWDASASTAKFYINGVQTGGDQTGSKTAVYNSTAAVEIGNDINHGTAQALDGLMDEVRIWNDVRTQSEIEDNMFEALVGNESNLVAYWNFNSTTTDKTSNGNNLTVFNGATFAEEPAHRVTCSVPSNSYLNSTLSINVSCQILGLF